MDGPWLEPDGPARLDAGSLGAHLKGMLDGLLAVDSRASEMTGVGQSVEFLKVLTTPRLAVEAVFNVLLPGGPYGIRAAEQDGQRALVLRQAETLQFRFLDDDEDLATAVVGVLPHYPAGGSRSVTVPTKEFLQAWDAERGPGSSGAETSLVFSGFRAEDAGLLGRLSEHYEEAGMVWVTEFDPDGTERWLGDCIFWNASSQGLQLTRRTTNSDGVEFLTMCGGSHDDLVELLRAKLADAGW